MRRFAFWFLFLPLGIVLLTGSASGRERAGPEHPSGEERFVYLYEGTEITLEPSGYHAAFLARGEEEGGLPTAPPPGLEIDPLSSRDDLRELGLTLYRRPPLVEPRGLEPEARPDAWTALRASGLAGQPVFEQGAVLKVPGKEVIVGFGTPLSSTGVRGVLSPVWERLGLSLVEEVRPATYRLALRGAEGGRALAISREIAALPGVLYAEPNFLNLFLETPGGPPETPPPPASLAGTTVFAKLDAPPGWRTPPSWERPPMPEDWVVLLDGHFESDGYDGIEHPDVWMRAHDVGATRALPGVTRHRPHLGERSVDMAALGLAGRRPPAPYADGIDNYLLSPPFSLAGYAAAYIELWFWARFEDPVRERRFPTDFARLLLYDAYEQAFTLSAPIAPVADSGDLTRDPTADHGWRRLLVRVPRELRGRDLRVAIQLVSDGAGGAEGLFVDDLRVVASALTDLPRVSDDPLSSVQHALAPAGQVAGRPFGEDPAAGAAAAWGYGFPEETPLVALVDDGVESGHPDLVAWAGDGTEDEPLSEEPLLATDRHGTACAGVLGAVADNGSGIAGVAPGTPILSLRRGPDDLGIALAIDAAVERGAGVIVLPWGWTGAPSSTIRRAITDALDAGTRVVAAAGDAGVHVPYSSDVDFPCSLGASTALLCVGAADPTGYPKSAASADGQYWWRTAFSETGPDLLAPGTWLHTTDLRGPLGYNAGSSELPAEWTDGFGGTGAAACYAAGVMALMGAHDPLMTPVEAKAILVDTAEVVAPRTSTRGASRLVIPEAAVVGAIELAADRRRAALEASRESAEDEREAAPARQASEKEE